MNLNEVRQQEVIELCKNLVKIPSLSGQEKEVAAYIEMFAKDNGFDESNIDSLGNVTLVMNGKEEGPVIVMDGHIDTVPVIEANWTVDPYSGLEKDGKIYGRGSTDMKGAVASMILAAKYFAEDTDKNFKGKIVVSCSVHEECFEGVATREVSAQYKPDYVVIGEATNLKLNNGQRGRAEVVVETFGKSAHSSNPDAGINAVNKMVKLIQAINELEVNTHPILGKGILELTDIVSSPYPGASVVPSNARVTFDRRLLVNETKESVLAPIQDIINRLKQEDEQFDAAVYYSSGKELCYTGATIEAERFFPAWLYDEEEEFVSQTLKNLQGILPETTLSHYSFCTNGSHFAGEAGIPTIGFGPSFEHLAHIDDEYIEKDQLLKATAGYISILNTLSNLKGGKVHV
ncbi:YgeY family selenium metabolism-linked hydrolase [Lysinibacillus antri]|uniref:YgeY family selenium metabolism-linked hydrolase n=1 Tax=Lysinibacillus antri TaxID=2498145 RepID=A0A3S0QNE3_9BACI|nr:YgeY family selenium metabolism-linked hydrolase [Lysinibacillus antri]RUL48810.1 YgeY family selenium metabolism-linked hydrolase [Lysinibacillus antri]